MDEAQKLVDSVLQRAERLSNDIIHLNKKSDESTDKITLLMTDNGELKSGRINLNENITLLLN